MRVRVLESEADKIPVKKRPHPGKGHAIKRIGKKSTYMNNRKSTGLSVLRKYRERLGLSCSEAARRAGIHRSWLVRCENGSRQLGARSREKLFNVYFQEESNQGINVFDRD